MREKRRRRRSAATAQAKDELQNSVQRAKEKMWYNYLKTMRRAEAWRGAKGTNPQAGMTVDASPHTDWKQPNTIAGKEEMLRRESFPLKEYDQYFELPAAGQAHLSLTEQGVKRTLFLPSVKNDPGPDKLSFGAVRLLWMWDQERIVELAKAAIRTG